MAVRGLPHAFCIVWVLAMASLVTSGRRVMAPQGSMDLETPDVAPGLMDHAVVATQVDDYPGERKLQKQESSLVRKLILDYTGGGMLQDQETSLSQQTDSSTGVEISYNSGDLPRCAEDNDGFATHCRLGSCKCGWSQQCYAKFTKGEHHIDEGVCATALPVLALLSFLVFVGVLSAVVATRAVLQCQALVDAVDPSTHVQINKPSKSLMVGTSSMGDSSETDSAGPDSPQPTSFDSVKQTEEESDSRPVDSVKQKEEQEPSHPSTPVRSTAEAKQDAMNTVSTVAPENTPATLESPDPAEPESTVATDLTELHSD